MTRALTDAGLKAFNDAVAPVLADLQRLGPMVSAGAARRAGPGAVTVERGHPGLDPVEAVRKAGDLRRSVEEGVEDPRRHEREGHLRCMAMRAIAPEERSHG